MEYIFGSLIVLITLQFYSTWKEDKIEENKLKTSFIIIKTIFLISASIGFILQMLHFAQVIF